MTKDVRYKLEEIRKTVDNVNSDEEVEEMREHLLELIVAVGGLEDSDLNINHHTDVPTGVKAQETMYSIELSSKCTGEIVEAVNQDLGDKGIDTRSANTNIQRIMPPNRVLIAAYGEDQEALETLIDEEDSI